MDNMKKILWVSNSLQTFCQQKSSFHSLPLIGWLGRHIEQLASENKYMDNSSKYIYITTFWPKKKKKRLCPTKLPKHQRPENRSLLSEKSPVNTPILHPMFCNYNTSWATTSKHKRIDSQPQSKQTQIGLIIPSIIPAIQSTTKDNSYSPA